MLQQHRFCLLSLQRDIPSSFVDLIIGITSADSDAGKRANQTDFKYILCLLRLLHHRAKRPQVTNLVHVMTFVEKFRSLRELDELVYPGHFLGYQVVRRLQQHAAV